MERILVGLLLLLHVLGLNISIQTLAWINVILPNGSNPAIVVVAYFLVDHLVLLDCLRQKKARIQICNIIQS